MKTWKYLLILMILFGSFNETFSQIKFGGNVGYGFATQSDLGNLCKNTDVISSYTFGVQALQPLNEWFALKAALNYGQKGRECDVLINGQDAEQTEKFGYLTVPVKAQFMAPIKKNSLFVAAGPYVGFLLDANQELDGLDTDIKDETSSTDLGLAMEIGVLFPKEKYDISVSLNYEMGLKELVDYDEDIRNKALTFNVGVFF